MDHDRNQGRGYILPFYVYHKDSDFREELRFTSLATFLQEAAWAHAKLMALDYHRSEMEGLLWVLSRLEVKFTGPMPHWRDTVWVRTFPVGMDRMFAQRDFVIWTDPGREDHEHPGIPLAGEGQGTEAKPFALARSSWLIIDAEKRSLVRPQMLEADFSAHQGSPVYPEAPGKLRDPGVWQETAAMPAPGYHDMDAHGHVNNVSYFEWVLANYDKPHHEQHRLREVLANFNAELGWSVPLFHDSTRESDTDLHGIRASGSTGANALIRLVWEERQ